MDGSAVPAVVLGVVPFLAIQGGGLNGVPFGTVRQTL